MRERLFKDFATRDGLTTEMGAMRRFEKLRELIDEQMIDHFVLIDHGKFVPVVRLRVDDHHLMHVFIQHKIGVM